MTFDEAVPFALPLARRFRGTQVREGVLVRIGDLWGEWAPFAEYDDAAASRWLAAATEQARGDWPAPVRDSVPVNAIVPALDPEAVTRMVLDAVAADGCTTVKVKVGEPGQAADDDVARVAAVRAALDDAGAASGRIRVDVNGAWSVDQAAERLEVLHDVALGLEFAEQPCATLGEMAALRERTSVPLAVDEGVRLASALDDATVDAVRVAAGLALAAALPVLDHACGLGTGRLLGADLTARTLLPEDGRLSPVRPAPDPAALAAAAARLDDSRRQWWLERLARCTDLLPGGRA